jgi:ribulose 1,5-bisphosphate synthetase/thiazole synthase
MYDVIVCGGGPSGINAAISAARMNSKVLLIETTGLIGGNSVLSLVGPWMTFHNKGHQIVRGLAQEMVSRLQANHMSLGHIPDPLAFCDTITPIDVEGVKALFFEMIEEEGIDLLLHAPIMDVIKEGNQIKGVICATKSGMLPFYGRVVIDATGDGDVCVMMGAKYMLGRIADGLSQPMTMIFHVANVNMDLCKDYMKEHPQEFVQKEDYDYGYLGISGFFSKVQEAKNNNEFSLPRDRVLLFEEVRPGIVSVNMTRVQGLSGVDALQRTKAEQMARKQIKEAFAFLQKYVPGFEHSYILRTPSQIGIRETRHIIGDYVMTVEDVLACKEFADSIALSGFPMDIHSPNQESLELLDQGDDFGYEIPMRSLLPKGIEGLIVSGRCISATHEAAASLRVTPTVMAIGEAAGILASIAVQTNVSPRDVHAFAVQEQLKKNDQVFKRSNHVSN